MKRDPTLFFVFAFLILAATALSANSNSNNVRQLNIVSPRDGPTRKMYFQSVSGNEDEILALWETLIDRGAKHVHCFLPDLIVCDLPVDLDFNRLLENVSISAHDPSLIEPFEESDRPFGLSWFKRCNDHAMACANRPRTIVSITNALIMHGSMSREIESSLIAPRESVVASMTAQEPGVTVRNIQQNSEMLVGKILVNLVLPQAYNTWIHWTNEQISDAVGGATIALLSYVERYRYAPIHFVFRTFRRAPCNFEPMRYNMKTDYQWIRDVIWHLGYAHGLMDHLIAVHQFNNHFRELSHTDWVCTAFIANSDRATHNLFHDARYIGYAYLGGPFLVIPFPAGDENPYRLEAMDHFAGVFLHEFLKVFWALYEYLPNDGGCSERSGYLNVKHLNAVYGIDPYFGIFAGCQRAVNYCIMIHPLSLGGPDMDICEFTAGMIGIIDKNENSVPDVYDSAPIIEFEHSEPETLLNVGEGIDIRLHAVSDPVPNKNPRQVPEERVSYAPPLNWGGYTADGLGPVELRPEDGQWDEIVEECSVFRSPTVPGYHEVVAWARNTAGLMSPPYKKVFYVLGLRFSPFQVHYENGGVRLSWDMIGDMFGADFTLYRINMENTPIDTLRIDRVLPHGPSTGSHTPFAYLDRAVHPCHTYRYYIKGSCTIPVEGVDSTFTYYSNPIDVTAMVPIRSGEIVSEAVPNPFNEMTYVSVRVPATFKEPDSPWDIPERIPTPVSIAIYDVLGRKVKDLHSAGVFSGVLTIAWDGTNNNHERVSSGVYFLSVISGNATGTAKIHVVR